MLGQTLQFSLLGAFLGALVAYPTAYFVGRMVRNNRSMLTVLVLVPLWISLLMRVFSWRLILGQNGVLNSSLVSSGLLEEPLFGILVQCRRRGADLYLYLDPIRVHLDFKCLGEDPRITD